MKLLGKTVIVTGAAAGMGEAIARKFAEEGAKVVATDIDKERLDQVVKSITESGNEVIGLVSNIANQEDIDKMTNKAVQQFGSLDVLVNNAGIMDNFVPVGDLTDQQWERIIAINLTGPFKAARAAINIMEKQEKGGVIINNASIGGLFGARGGAAYVTSKHGLLGMTKNIAATYGIHGKIRANAIAPGGVATNIQSTITEPHPLGSQAIGSIGGNSAPLGQAEEIAEVALFLASDASSFVNGAIITADGGWTAS